MAGGEDYLPLEKERGSVEILPPQTVKLASGANSGEVEVRVSGASGKKTYIFAYTPDPATDSSKWTEEFDTKVKHLLKGLDPAKKYGIRVGVIGKDGVKVYSHIVTYIVQ